MRLGRRDDVHKIDVERSERRLGVGERPRDSQALRAAAGLLRVTIADGDDLDVGHPPPRVEMELAEVAGPDAQTAQRAHAPLSSGCRGSTNSQTTIPARFNAAAV